MMHYDENGMMHYDDNELMHYDDEEAKTWVFWDISSCPVPDGCDARLVGSIIGSALKEKGYSDRLTITAIGNLIHTLKRTPHVLPALSSTGVLLNHTPRGNIVIMDQAYWWTDNNPAPATLLLITGDVPGKQFLRGVSGLKHRGHTVLEAFPKPASEVVTSEESFLWESLMKDLGETRRPEVQKKCCETDESLSSFICDVCDFTGESYEDFTTHLKSTDHALSELDIVERPITKNMANFIDYYRTDPTISAWCNSAVQAEEWDRFTV